MNATQGLGINHVQVMVQGMYELAKIDGVHATELVMLREFYNSCQTDSSALTDFDDLARQPFNAGDAVNVLNTAELREMFLRSCVYLAYGDGSYSDGERRKIKTYADALGLSAAELALIETEVGDVLIQQISRIENVDALKTVAQEIKR
jgi:tellurite resistance protein